MHLTVSLYAALLGLLYAALTARVLYLRGALDINLGDAGHPTMLRAVRIHGNFAEYVPFCLLLMYLSEVQAAPQWLLHALGVLLVAGRLMHAYALAAAKLAPRVIGMISTLTVLLVSCGYLGFVQLR